MKLFKNPVGRPPKDLKKKRAITVLVIAVVILLGGTIATINILGINVLDLMGNSTSKGKQVTITFDANGGVGNMPNKQQTKPGKGKIGIKLPKNKFKREGYEFVGWIQKSKLCLVNQTCCNDDKCLYYQGKRDETYANFKGKQTVSLPVIKQGNREAIVYNRMVEGTQKNKKRYLNLIKDGSTVEIGSNLNLVAVWANTFTIEFSKGSDTSVKGAMNEQTIQYKNPTRITKNTFTKQGYTFAGWKLKNKETGLYRGCTDENVCNTTNPTFGWHNETEIKNFVLYKDGVSVSTTTKPGKTIIFEATFEEAKEITVNYVKNNSKATGNMKTQKVTYASGTKATKNKFKLKNYTFAGWKVYDVTAKKWKGCTNKTNCTNTNKTLGWYTKAELKNGNYYILKDQANISKEINQGTLKLVATWEKASYKITFNANGGKIKHNGKSTGKTKQTITYKLGDTNKTKAEKSNHTFGGWYTKSNCSGAISGVTYGKKISVTKNTTVYACWYKNGGSGSNSGSGVGTGSGSGSGSDNKGTDNITSIPTNGTIYYIDD